MSFLCRLGFHKYFRIAICCETHGDGVLGEVLQCRRCGRYTKWGKAYYPDYILEEMGVEKNE